MTSTTGDQVLQILCKQRRIGIPDSLRNVASLMLLGEGEEDVRRVFGNTSVYVFNYKVAENLRDGQLTHAQRSAVRRTERAIERLLADATLTEPQREHLQRLQLDLLVGAHV